MLSVRRKTLRLAGSRNDPFMKFTLNEKKKLRLNPVTPPRKRLSRQSKDSVLGEIGRNSRTGWKQVTVCSNHRRSERKVTPTFNRDYSSCKEERNVFRDIRRKFLVGKHKQKEVSFGVTGHSSFPVNN